MESTDITGFFDSALPYNSSGNITNGGDYHPLTASAAPEPIVSYGESVHAKRNVRFAWRALGEPDGKGALMLRNARIAIELEDVIPECGKVSVSVRRAALRTPSFDVAVSSDGATWTQIGSASCSSSAWTRYDFTGDWSDVKYIGIRKPGTWRKPKMMGLDAVCAEGSS